MNTKHKISFSYIALNLKLNYEAVAVVHAVVPNELLR